MIPEHPDAAMWSAGGQLGQVELHQRETIIQHGQENLKHLKMMILKNKFAECEFLKEEIGQEESKCNTFGPQHLKYLKQDPNSQLHTEMCAQTKSIPLMVRAFTDMALSCPFTHTAVIVIRYSVS